MVWTGAIIGGIAGLLAVIFVFMAKEQRFNKVLRSIKEPGMEYAALFHYASYTRYRSSFKFYDSYGVLYIVGKMLYYKPKESDTPLSFNLDECSVQMEKDWRMLKWFSITTPAGEKYYFNSHKMGIFKSNSDETVRGFKAIEAKKAA